MGDLAAMHAGTVGPGAPGGPDAPGDFAGSEELLADFLTEAGELLTGVDQKLIALERTPGDKALLNDIFRGFHTIKGGAGFLAADALVGLCHRTENLFDRLRKDEIVLTPETLDGILAATAAARGMFDALAQARLPAPADGALLATLESLATGNPAPAPAADPPARPPVGDGVPTEPDWGALYAALFRAPGDAGLPTAPPATPAAASPAHPRPGATAGSPPPALTRGETTLRVDTARLDQVLNLAGEIGLAKNRLNCVKGELLAGRTGADALKALEEAVGHLDLLVGDLQNAVMKTRMQPVGRLFQKYPRLARDLARQLGKDVELLLEGEDTELDKTMVEELGDPLVHLVRNAVDHGIEAHEDRVRAGKPAKSVLRLSASQAGDHVVIEIADDGRGMDPELIRRKAVEKGLLEAGAAQALDARQCLNLIFLPGFSTKAEASDLSGRGVGMDVVKTNVQKLNGRIEIDSEPGRGTRFTVTLPLTLAILPVLVVRLDGQPFALPLSAVREIVPLTDLRRVAGRPTLVLRDEVLPVRSLADLLGWPQRRAPAFGVILQVGGQVLALAVDGFSGRDDVVVKPIATVKPHGVAGATLAGDGGVVLVLDLDALFQENPTFREGLAFRKDRAFREGPAPLAAAA